MYVGTISFNVEFLLDGDHTFEQDTKFRCLNRSCIHQIATNQCTLKAIKISRAGECINFKERN